MNIVFLIPSDNKFRWPLPVRADGKIIEECDWLKCEDLYHEAFEGKALCDSFEVDETAADQIWRVLGDTDYAGLENLEFMPDVKRVFKEAGADAQL